MRLLAGIPIPDTPLISSSIAYAKKYLSPLAYNHIMRSLLFGLLVSSKLPFLQSRDLETHAIAAILHDLGWSHDPSLISADKRFEVDGANEARRFIIEIEGRGDEWDEQRLQLVWDAIALHTTPSIALHKQKEVVATCMGIGADLLGPEGVKLQYSDLMASEGVEGELLSWDEWERVNEAFPRLKMKEGLREIMCGLCRTKPSTTWDNFVGGYGERFVEGYTLEGKRVIDLLENFMQD